MTNKPPIPFVLTNSMINILHHIHLNVARLITPLNLHGFQTENLWRHIPYVQRMDLIENKTQVKITPKNIHPSDKQCLIVKNLRVVKLTLQDVSDLSSVPGTKTEPVSASQWLINNSVEGFEASRTLTIEEQISTTQTLTVTAELGFRVWAEAEVGVSLPIGVNAAARAGVEVTGSLGIGVEISRTHTVTKTNEYNISAVAVKPRMFFANPENKIYVDRSIIKKPKQQTLTWQVVLGFDIEVWSTGIDKVTKAPWKGWLEPIDEDKEGETPSYKWIDTEGAGLLDFFDGEGEHAHSFREAVAKNEHPLRRKPKGGENRINASYKTDQIKNAAKALQDESVLSFVQEEKVVFDNATNDNLLIYKGTKARVSTEEGSMPASQEEGAPMITMKKK